MKISRSLSAAFVAALVTAACGGGGGGGDSSPAPTVPTVPVVVVTPTPVVPVVTPTPVVVVTPVVPVVTPTPVVPTPIVVTVTCPNGATVASATDCPAVGTAPIALQGSVMSPVSLDNGVTIQFNGALNPSTVMIMLKQGDSILGSTWSIAGGNKDVTFKPAVRLAYGQAYTVMLTATDTLGRAVSVSFSFATFAMTCSRNDVWSNPATYSTTYQDCVAPVGVQALVTPSLNTMTDTSCTPTVGIPLSAACKAYLGNGTILLADTSIVANNHALMWMAYVSADGKSNLVLLDTTAMAPIGTMVLPGSLAWIIGNPTGAAISVKVGTLLRNEQIKWDGAAIAVTCYTNC